MATPDVVRQSVGRRRADGLSTIRARWCLSVVDLGLTFQPVAALRLNNKACGPAWDARPPGFSTLHFFGNQRPPAVSAIPASLERFGDERPSDRGKILGLANRKPLVTRPSSVTTLARHFCHAGSRILGVHRTASRSPTPLLGDSPASLPLSIRSCKVAPSSITSRRLSAGRFFAEPCPPSSCVNLPTSFSCQGY